MAHKIVFLDRESLDAKVREFSFPHEYTEYESTWTPEEIVERLKGAEIALINKVPMRAETLKQLPDLKLIAVAATGTDVVDKAAAKDLGITVVNIRNYAFNTVPERNPPSSATSTTRSTTSPARRWASSATGRWANPSPSARKRWA
jgi:glycerate dehydrogenase